MHSTTLWPWFRRPDLFIIAIFAGGAFFASPVAHSAPDSVYISELVASNETGARDEDGDAGDWLELHNAGSVTVDLSGWTLSDDTEDPGKWPLPELDLAPDTYLLIWASGKDRRDAPSLHANFKLDRDGEQLTLYNPQGNLVSMPGGLKGYPSQEVDYGYAYHGGEDAYVYTASPTPGTLNDLRQWYWGRLDAPVFSQIHGLFEEDFLLDIDAPAEKARVYYSLDGSVPSRQDGIAFDNALTVSNTSVFRAVAAAENWLPSRPVTRTYLFPHRVAGQQAPSHYPTQWGDGHPADYGIDGNIVESPDYRERFVPALKSLPSLSLVFDASDFFDAETGIYMNTLEDGRAWERPVSAEFFGAGESGIMIDAGIRIQGRSSRQPQTTPKHSFRLLFKRDYGPDQLEYPLFDDDAVSAFDTLVLRATSNHSWLYPVAEQRQRAQYLRDPWTKATQRAMGHVAPRTRFVHLYLNGLYWGLYNISERPDDQFMAAHLGGKKSDYDVRKGGEMVEGNPRSWRKLFAVAESPLDDGEKFHAMESLMDMDSFIDFMILNHYIGNETWDFGNWYAGRNREQDDRFQFFAWDAETSMNRISENVVFTRNNDRPTALFHLLRHLPEFQERFAARLTLHCTGDGALTPAANARRFVELAKTIDTAIVAESARWGDYRLTKHEHRTGPYERYTRDGHWLKEQKRLLESYFPRRTDILLGQYASIGLWPPK